MLCFLVLFDKTFEGCFGHIDRIFTLENDAEMYCVAQNRVSISEGFEHWYVTIDQNDNSVVAHRVHGSKHLIQKYNQY